jgi:hypothetical protein
VAKANKEFVEAETAKYEAQIKAQQEKCVIS